ncbi:MAG: TRAP transporter large permease [Bacillota bacterium]
MSSTTIALLGILFMFILMMLRMPVGFSMFFAGFIGFSYYVSPKAAYGMLSTDIWGGLASYGLSVVPMFVFMGQIAFRSGVTENLYAAAYKWVGNLRGGMAATTIAASTAFAAICGSNAATAATMGTIALPQMKKYGYNAALSTGSVAAGGTLGVVIPPSVVLIVIALQTEQSIARLFIANIIPGLLLSALFLLTVLFVCMKYPDMGPAGPKTTFREKMASLPGAIEPLILFALVIGGLYLGWFTPTEAGAAGSFGALIIALLQRKLNWKAFTLAVTDTLRISTMVMILITGAVAFGRFLTVTRLPFALSEWAASLPVPPFVVLLVVVFIYVLGGALMDALGFLTLSIPIFFPLALSLGYDPVWYTVLITVITTMGAITPPVGVNAFIVKGLSPDVSMDTIFKGIFMFMAAYVVCITLLWVFPQIALFLPDILY